jgi:hypothetical protein
MADSKIKNSALCCFVRYGEGYVIQSSGRLRCVFLFVSRILISGAVLSKPLKASKKKHK